MHELWTMKHEEKGWKNVTASNTQYFELYVHAFLKNVFASFRNLHKHFGNDMNIYEETMDENIQENIENNHITGQAEEILIKSEQLSRILCFLRI